MHHVPLAGRDARQLVPDQLLAHIGILGLITRIDHHLIVAVPRQEPSSQRLDLRALVHEVPPLPLNKGLAIVVCAPTKWTLLFTLGALDKLLEGQEACLVEHVTAREDRLLGKIQIFTTDRTLDQTTR